jgi:hypothetical protein
MSKSGLEQNHIFDPVFRHWPRDTYLFFTVFLISIRQGRDNVVTNFDFLLD